MATSRFPDVDFDWLGELPNIARESAAYRERKEALADLPENASPSDLRARANRLLRSPNLKSQEAGARLYTMALGREGLSQKGQEQASYLKFLQGGGGISPFRPPSAPADSGVVDVNAGEPGPTGANPFENAPTQGLQVPTDRRAPGPGAALPPGPEPMAAEPLQRVAALGGAGSLPPEGAPPPPPMPPSEAMLAQAQGAMAQGPPPAGPPPQQMAQAPGQSMMDAARIPIGPPPAPPRPPMAPAGSPDRQRAQTEAQHWANEYAKLPPKSQNSPLGQALKANMTKALSVATPDKDMIQWNIENAQRRQDKEPLLSFNDFMNQNKTVEERYKNSNKAYSVYHDDEKKGRDLLNTIGPMEAIAKHPDFASGAGTGLIAQFKSGLVGLKSNAESLGVPKDAIERILPVGWQKIQNTTKLQEAFTALSNQAIYAKLGSLGNQISTSDRDFVNAAFPSLSLTPQGNRLLLQILKENAVHMVRAGEKAREYMSEKDTRASQWGLHNEIQKWADQNPLFMSKDGNLTAKGKALVSQGVPIPGQGGPQAAPERVPPPPDVLRGRAVKGPDGKPYRLLPGGQLVPEGHEGL